MGRQKKMPPGYPRLPQEILDLGVRRVAWKKEGDAIRSQIPALTRRAMSLRSVSMNTVAYALDMKRASLRELLLASDAQWVEWYALNLDSRAGTFMRENGRMPESGELD